MTTALFCIDRIYWRSDNNSHSFLIPYPFTMSSWRDLIGYFSKYKAIAILSIVASSLFEIIDLVVPYCIGQILNVLSEQPLDKSIVGSIALIQNLGIPPGKWLSLGVLLGIIFMVTVIRAPIQPWIGVWHHWAIALKARRDHFSKVVGKILTLPVGYYDENNPGPIAGRITRGIENHTWTYPEISGQLIPKLARIMGIFVMILFIDTRIAIAFLFSFITTLTVSSMAYAELEPISQPSTRLSNRSRRKGS